MRDVLFLSVLAPIVIGAALHPWIGVLAWTWLSVMNPHRYTWAVSNLPVAAAVAIATFIGLLITRDRRRVPVTPTTVLLLLFMGWMGLTTATAFYQVESLDMLKRVLKIDLMVLVTLAVLFTRRHIEWFVWVNVISLGYYGVKGGLFTLLGGGAHLVWGPPDSFIEGNNELALALIMTIPLMRYLQLVSANRWVRYGLMAAMLLSAIAALGSYSRGALLAIVAMGAYFWIRSREKVLLGTLIAIVMVVAVAFMPEEWAERMWTIQTYDQDQSALGRLNAWWMTYNLAKDRLLGGGFMIYKLDLFERYAPVADPRAAHSIYFQVLGEHGFIGLGLFLLFWFLVWRSASWVHARAAKSDETRWAAQLVTMCQVGLVGYVVGGAFLSLAYFDLPYNLMAMIVLTRYWMQERERTAAAPVAPNANDPAHPLWSVHK